jgi:hypothetical protein
MATITYKTATDKPKFYRFENGTLIEIFELHTDNEARVHDLRQYYNRIGTEIATMPETKTVPYKGVLYYKIVYFYEAAIKDGWISWLGIDSFHTELRGEEIAMASTDLTIEGEVKKEVVTTPVPEPEKPPVTTPTPTATGSTKSTIPKWAYYVGGGVLLAVVGLVVAVVAKKKPKPQPQPQKP